MLMSDLQNPAPLWCTPTAMHSEPNDASDEENNNGHDHHDYSLAQRAVFYLCCVCLLSAKVTWGLLGSGGCGWQVVGGGQWLVVGELVVELVAVVAMIVHQWVMHSASDARWFDNKVSTEWAIVGRQSWQAKRKGGACHSPARPCVAEAKGKHDETNEGQNRPEARDVVHEWLPLVEYHRD